MSLVEEKRVTRGKLRPGHQYNRPSMSLGSVHVDSTNCKLKISLKICICTEYA